MTAAKDSAFGLYGPRQPPRSRRETSDAGYKIPRSFNSTRHLERNLEIVKAVANCRDKERPKVVERLAKKFTISPNTVRYIARYFKTPEAP